MSLVGKGLARQLGVLGTGIVLGLVIRLAQTAVVARLLGVAEFGKLAAVLAFVAILSRVTDLGLPASVSYYFRRERGSLPSILRIVGFNFVLCCVVALAVTLGAPHWPLPFAKDLGNSPALRLAFAAFLALSTPSTILPGLLTAAGDYGSYVRLSNLTAILQAVLVLGAILWFGTTYEPIVAALALAQLVAIALYLWYVGRYRQQAPAVPLPARVAYRYGLRLQWGVIMKLVSARADLFIVGALLPVHQVGLYSVALGLRDLGLLPQSVYAAPFINLVIDRSRDDRFNDRIPVLTTLIFQIGLSIVMVIAAAVALPLLIPLVYGRGFAPAVEPSLLLVFSLIFLAPASLCWMTFNAKGHPHLTSAVLTASGVVGAGLAYLLLAGGYGLAGAALAAVLTSIVTLGLSLLLLQRLQRYTGSDVRAGLGRVRGILGVAASQLRSYVHRLVGPEA